jgi:outer membrane protein assembly factor BamB
VVEYRYCGLPVRDGGSVAVSRCLFDLGTGKADLQKTNGFYHIPETGVYMPRTAWRYGNERQLSPVAACRGSSLFGVEPAGGKLFRVDFEKGKAFNSEWVRVSPEDQKAGWTRATGKLFKLGAKWATGGDDAKQAAARALLVAGGNVFIATPKGLLAVHNADDGTKMAERKLGEIVWDGLAAANGRLYVSTAEGKVICLGPK